MHAVSHSLAHRAPPATRTRMRWQPYNSVPSCVSIRSPQLPFYLHTPTSNVSSPSSSSSVSEESESKPPPPVPFPKESLIRDLQKNKYVVGLVDQAVTSLCEIWQPQDIPTIFLTSSKVTVSAQTGTESVSSVIKKTKELKLRNTQLPSPVSPPSSHSIATPPPSTSAAANASELTSANLKAHGTLIPIKGFVHEVLRRSRTSGCVLQTALCYLEAIRSKIPELVRLERSGEGIRGEADLESRIVKGEIGLDNDADFVGISSDVTVNGCSAADEYSMEVGNSFQLVASISQAQMPPQDQSKKLKAPSAPLPALPDLPSPLLCPRRAFLASLILASKFTQDKCYSNRAWAKLSGLPPREIGRCERALGDALDWRLWVGKAPAPAPKTSQRPVVRCHSDGDLLSSSKMAHARRAQSVHGGEVASCGTSSGYTANLRRWSTIPASGFTDPWASAPAPSFAPVAQPEWTPYMPQSYANATPMQMQIHGTEGQPQSPNMATPTLTYSPSSTESSGGDRTIQMTNFIDDPTGSFGVNAACAAYAGEGTKTATSVGVFGGYQCTAQYAPINPAMSGGPDGIFSSGVHAFHGLY